jgi:hypothetical protein
VVGCFAPTLCASLGWEAQGEPRATGTTGLLEPWEAFLRPPACEIRCLLAAVGQPNGTSETKIIGNPPLCMYDLLPLAAALFSLSFFWFLSLR